MIRNNTMYVHIHMWNLCLPQYERQEIYSHRKNIFSNLLFSDFFSKKVAFMEALPKIDEINSKFPQLPQRLISQNFCEKIS